MPNPNKVTERLFQSPSKYIQGPYAIKNAAKYLSKLGTSPLLLCDDIVWNIGTRLSTNVNRIRSNAALVTSCY